MRVQNAPENVNVTAEMFKTDPARVIHQRNGGSLRLWSENIGKRILGLVDTEKYPEMEHSIGQ